MQGDYPRAFTISFDTAESPAKISLLDIDRYIFSRCANEASAAAGEDRFDVQKEEVVPADPSLGLSWTGAITFVVTSLKSLRAVCRGLCVGLRNLVERPSTSFELEIRVGKNAARVTAQQIGSAVRDAGNEVAALEQLLTTALQGMRDATDQAR